MPDLQDWYKKVDILAKAANRRATQAADRVVETADRETANGHGVASHGNGAGPVPAEPVVLAGLNGRSSGSVLPPRKGRGPRKQETREELLTRLLDPTLTLEETARILQVCPTTVRRYTNKGILPYERTPGNQRRFKWSSVQAFIETQARAGVKADLDGEDDERLDG